MLTYVLKSIILLSLMYIPYMLMLRKESFFRFNRFMLILIMLLSLGLPFADIHSIAWEENKIADIINPTIEIGMPVTIDAEYSEGRVENSISWWLIAQYVYVAGAVIVLFIKLMLVLVLNRRMHSGVLWTSDDNGVKVFCHVDDTAPYSWFGNIVISQSDYEKNAEEILKHEMGHVLNRHSWDILMLNIVQIVQWINPLSWIMGSSLRDVHEYEADDAVLKSGIEMRQYQTLLIRKAIGVSSYSFANGFNHSLLTKRIKMMLRKKSNPWLRTKGLYVVLVAGIALSAFATPELNNKVDAFVAEPSIVENEADVAPASVVSSVSTVVSDLTVKSTEIDAVVGDTVAMEPLVVVDGEIVPYEQINDIEPNTIENITVLKDEKAVKKYGEQAKNGVIEIKIKKSSAKKETTDGLERVFEIVDNMPTYPGGMGELMKFLRQNVKYPEIAAKTGIEARVIVTFVVEKDGSISNITVLKNLPKGSGKSVEDVVAGYATMSDADKITAGEALKADKEEAKKALETEAVRVISLMLKWEPGTQNGKPVRVKYAVPISFKL